MGASPKNKRQQPSRNFEDYVLTYEVGSEAGLYPIDNVTMTYVEGAPGHPFTDEGGFVLLDIGFGFKFENKIYTKLVVNANGWCCLLDPNRSTFDISEVSSGGTAASNNLLDDTFVYDHVMICPWWDDLRNVFRGINDSSTDTYLNNLGYTTVSQRSQIRQEMSSGKKAYFDGFDPSLGGIKYKLIQNSPLGKCLVIRWKSFSFWNLQDNILTFDLAIYENGSIEFRYAPRQLTKYLGSEGATIGIFSYRGQAGSPKYRDLGGILVGADTRGQFENGGMVYDGSYTNGGAKYNCTLNSFQHWPGLGQFGAIFKFSPPNLKRKTVRSIVNARDSETFIDSSVLFNDQNTFNAISTRVQYPSMLPVSSKLSPLVPNEMFQSGSVELIRTVQHGLYDSPLYDAIVEKRRKE